MTARESAANYEGLRTEHFKFCPRCAKALGPYRDYRRACPACGQVIFDNPAACAGVLLLNERGQVLLTRRAKPPRAGSYGLAGGFCQPGETALEAARRETKEETGLTDFEVLDLLGTFPDLYGNNGAYTLSLIFVARLLSGQPRPVDDISVLEWHDIDNLPEAVFAAGFAGTHAALHTLQRWYADHESLEPEPSHA